MIRPNEKDADCADKTSRERPLRGPNQEGHGKPRREAHSRRGVKEVEEVVRETRNVFGPYNIVDERNLERAAPSTLSLPRGTDGYTGRIEG